MSKNDTKNRNNIEIDLKKNQSKLEKNRKIELDRFKIFSDF